MEEVIIPAYKWKKMDTEAILASIEIAIKILKDRVRGTQEKDMIKHLIEQLLTLL